MSRLLLPFRRLRWQLTLSYIMITLVAALTLEVATTVVGVLNPPKTYSATPAEILVNAMTFTEVPQITPYLAQTPPDQHGLTIWANLWAYGFTFSKLGFASGSPSHIPLDSDGAQNIAVAIVDRNGQVLASATAATSPIGALVASPQAQAALQTALVANAKPGAVFQTRTLADGRTVAAVPVAAEDKDPILGALLVAANLKSGPPPPAVRALPIALIAAAFKDVLPSALLLVVLASVVGTLFGVLTSRGITRRLRRITLAADAWRRGEFQTTVSDAGRDELGHLAADLNSMAEQIQRLLITRQELAVVEERHRLARDLHDSVKQQLFVVTMLVGAARASIAANPEAERTLGDAEQVAGQAQQELTALIRALRPVALAHQDLSAALHELCDEWSQRTAIPARVSLPEAMSLAAPAQQEVYRVAQEALANVARHSGATAVTVRVDQACELFTLSIEDNGHGFDPAQRVERGLGLQTMRERLAALGGVLVVQSSEASTRVEARVPLALAAAVPAE